METKVFTYTTELEWLGGRRSVARAGGRSEIVVAQGIDHSASVPKFAALAADGSDVELVVGMTPAPDQPPPM